MSLRQLPTKPCSRIASLSPLVAALLATCVALSACDTDTPDDADTTTPDVEPWIAVGGATDEGKGWVDWTSGDVTPPMLRGPQGGQHVWVSVRMRGLKPTKLRMTVEMRIKETGNVVKPGAVPVMRTIKPLEGVPDTYAFSAITAFVKCPCQVANRRVVVSLKVDDLYGRTETTEAEITPSWDGDCSLGPSTSCKDQ